MDSIELFPNLNLYQYANSQGVRFLFITGIPTHLQGFLVDKCVNDLNFNFIFSKRNNNDIQKYFSTLEVVDTKDNANTLSAFEFTLEQDNFERVTKVTNVGEWTKKGDLLSFWPIGYEHPIRISFFDQDIEYIEIFDEVYNIKIATIHSFLIGNISKLPDKVDWMQIKLSGYEDLNNNLILIFSQNELHDKTKSILDFDYSFPQIYYKRFDILGKEIQRLKDLNWNIYIETKHKSELPIDLQSNVVEKISIVGDGILKDSPAGFSSESNKILFLTDRELFGTLFLNNVKRQVSTKQAQKILAKLEGDVNIDEFVVHEDHGVGRYKGMHQEKRVVSKIVDLETVESVIYDDFLKIEYAEGDELLIPLAQIHKITKYIGTTSEDPIVTRLHKGDWTKSVKRAKKAVELIARDLVNHYAKLHTVVIKGIEYEDSEDYLKFEHSFEYDETSDQLSAISDVKKDLSSSTPMDRLIVGDVGFGKTEVAMRAAFKIVEAGQQVAVLCPTTILAIQHFKVFEERFKPFGIQINFVSRFNTPSINKQIIQDTKAGKVDILIGTHRLLSNDVEFKKLGLIVIDEEQKFGVKQKEKIRKIQYGSHSLAMSATPIPRTLSMAISQIREISIIATPPTKRKAVQTSVDKINWNKIAEELLFEVKRGGQAYFLHNRVETIESIKLKLQNLLPDVRFVVGHGKMRANQLDKVVREFYNKQYDVLICTTIIENGIDMPNVNTIVINNAQNFGLGQLYQLRGRVGRSDKQAYCYLYYKGQELDEIDASLDEQLNSDEIEQIQKKKEKNAKYIKRLKAILESQELGSGFKIASRDMEIRGAGNLLGEQQHGNIENVGLALYMQLLAEEIERLKNLSL